MKNVFMATLAYENHEWIPQLVDKFPGLRIYDCSTKNLYKGPNLIERIENKGFTANWNYVFDRFLETDCEYIWMTNNDIEIETSTFQRMLDVLIQSPNAGATVASYNSHHQPLRNHGKGVRPVPFMEQTSPLYRRQAIASLKEKLGEVLYSPITMGWGVDIICSYELRQLGYELLVIDDVEFRHFIAGNAKVVYDNKKNYTKAASKDKGSHVSDYIGRGWKKKLLQGLEQYEYKL